MSGDYSPFNPDDPRNQPGGDDLPLVNEYLKIPEYDRHRRALAYDGLVAEVARLSVENKTVIAQLDRNAVAHIASQRSLCDQRDRILAERDDARRQIARVEALLDEIDRGCSEARAQGAGDGFVVQTAEEIVRDLRFVLPSGSRG